MAQLTNQFEVIDELHLQPADAQIRDTLLAIVRSLVDEPDRVVLLHVAEGNQVAFQIRTTPDDAGKVIGRKGRTAQAIRVILTGSGMKNGRIYTLDLAPQPKLK